MTHSQTSTGAPQPRRGCSCWLVILTFIFLVSAVAVVSFLTYKQHLEDQAFQGWTSADRQAFEQWSSAPLDIPSSFLELRKPPSAEVDARRKKVFADSVNVLKLEGSFGEIFNDLGLRLLRSESMSTTDSKIVSAYTTTTKQIFEQIAQVATHPDFVWNLRTPLGSYYDLDYYSAVELTNDYTRATAYQGNTAAATDALSTTLLLFRGDPEADLIPEMIDEVLTTTLYVSQLTSDPLALTEILQSLNNARGYFHNFELLLGLPQTMLLNMSHQMEENGYIRKMPRTWGGLATLGISFEDYLQWLKRKLPANDPKAIHADKMLSEVSGGGYLSQSGYLKHFQIGLLKPYVRQLLFAQYGLQGLATMYLQMPAVRQNLQRIGARYDLTRLALARRIAVLTGKPVPTSPEDFVPHYMPEFPKDPFSSGALQFSQTKDAFYSVGPDAVANTADDLYFLPADDLSQSSQTH